jgi:HEAT repeat protein
MPSWFLRVLLLAAGLGLASAGRSAADRFPEDPVEQFRQALLLENNKSINYKNRMDLDDKALGYALKFRRENLEKARKLLKNPSDLSRALLLLDWPRVPRPGISRGEESKYDRGARDIERKVREEMAADFRRQVQEIILRDARTPDAIARQVATTNLVGETVASAADLQDETLYLHRDLEPLVKDLARLAGASSYRVREAAARALGQFPNSPKIAPQALARLLGPGNPESTRRAAAEALLNLAQTVSSSQPIRGSEPGVSTRETRRTGRIFFLEDVAALVPEVTKAAGIGLGDESAAVRRASVNALRQGAEALAFEVKVLLPVSTSEIALPPPERPWSKEEQARVNEYRREVADKEKQVMPALRAYRGQAAALLRVAADRDTGVRLGARRTLEALARTRDLLDQLRSSIPTRGKGGDEGMSRRDRGPGKKRTGLIVPVGAEVALPAAGGPPPIIRLPAADDKDKEKDKDEKDEKKDDKGKAVDEGDKEPDPIGQLLDEVAEGLVRGGFSDPNPVARRASFEALESMGAASRPFIPRLVQGLKDPDLFVRWIAARALGKLAPRQAEVVVPALACNLDDPDLDPRIAAARALGQYGPLARGAVEALTARLSKGDAEFRLAAMKALEDIGTDSAPALPALARSLRDIDPRVRAEAARIIGRFGSAARGHVEALRRLTTDPDSDVRKAASAAILTILPEK